MNKAFITGITGQDGTILTQFLLDRGYEVHGLIRRASTFNTIRLESIYPHNNPNLYLYYGDLADSSALHILLDKIKPTEIYHLGAMSHVRVSFDMPLYTGDITALGTTRLLEAYRNVCPESKFYNAASSEMFGKVAEIPQTETTPFYPRSPYGVAKLYSYWMSVNYRESYKLYISNGILFNHEEPGMRGPTFVTRKISMAAARIKRGLQDKLYLGNLEAKRDWGRARDYIEAMYMMLQQDEPGDYVVATGETHSVRDFLCIAFDRVGLNYMDYVEIDQRYYRPAEVDLLIGDASRAKSKLGWTPKTSFEELVTLMVDADLQIIDNGGTVFDYD